MSSSNLAIDVTDSDVSAPPHPCEGLTLEQWAEHGAGSFADAAAQVLSDNAYEIGVAFLGGMAFAPGSFRPQMEKAMERECGRCPRPTWISDFISQREVSEED